MDQLIPIVNKLQDVFGAIGHHGIDLPQIVVVGSQSSGKSSVLESLVGQDFLPRGAGICTRRPLVLQLYTTHRGNESNDKSEWGEFFHLPGQKFYDFNEIRNEIQRETDRVTGKNKGISNKTINLKVFSPHVLNLTLVDLPGITKVPTGDQPEDVEDQIRAMCYEFITNPNAIILAVSAANQDLVNSEGLKMARQVDPDGDRTIGVLTKVDIMDQGTDCMDILTNKLIPLKRGYIAVVNRSQKDIQDNIPIRNGLAKEQTFFQSHAKYRQLLPRCGTQNLSRSLNQILIHHIKTCLPDIKSRITKMLIKLNASMEELGEPYDSQGYTKQGGILLKLITKFTNNISNCIDGKGSADGNIDMTEVRGGARLNYIFNEIFSKSLKNFDAFSGLDDMDIIVAITNANGPRPALFVPEMTFDLLVRKQIAKLEQPGLQCVDFVFEEMHRMSIQSETSELNRFPNLKEKVFEIVHKNLRACVIPTQKMISNLIQIELSYINTSHPDFIGGKMAANLAQSRIKQNQQAAAQPEASASTIYPNIGTNNPSSTNANGSTSNANSSESADVSSGKKYAVMSNGVNNTTQANNQPSNATTTNPTTNSQTTQPSGGFLGFLRPSIDKTNDIKAENKNDTKLDKQSDKQVYKSSNDNSFKNNNINNYNIWEDKSVKLPMVPDKMKHSPVLTDREIFDMEVIKCLIASYFDLVKKNFTDMVPKAIMHFLVNAFKESLPHELVAELYKDNLISELMKETDDVANKRKACREMKDLLQKALEIVNEVREYNNIK
uniref:Dynamin GTPase n=1 Tax=Chromulina nebulosa TaxID=96789 RepID=A0A7S0XCP8_9STRA|mmetsp:Transcript_2479/g.2210  ORF Transcript_2479/g.2210 Transcript_2479/m.2210 type:complete len:778 (+) Transcript_2479:76-2409(+)